MFAYQETDGTKTIDIILSNTSGTTGTYIDNITISGANYTLAESYSNLFLGANATLTIQAVLNDTTQEESNGSVTVTYNNTDTLNIILDGDLDSTLSTQSNDKRLGTIIAYPSPTKSTFTINKPLTYLGIYDLTGKLVKVFSGNFDSNKSYNVSRLKSNLYIIVAKDANNQQYTTKLIKK